MQSFEESLPMLMNRALDAIMPKYRAVFSDYDITEQQWRVLRVLWEQGRCTTSALSDRTLLSNPSLVGIVDRMAGKGLVRRTRSDSDRRLVFVEATPAGRALQAKIGPRIDRVYEELMSQTNDRDWRTLLRTLKTFIAANENSPAQVA